MITFQAHRFDSFDSLPQPYAPVFEAAAEESIFFSLPWFRNLAATTVGSDERARIYGVESLGQPVGALAMRLSPSRGGFLAPARLDAMSNYYTSLFAPAVAAGTEMQTILRAFVDALWADRREWDVLDLHPLDRDAPWFAAMAQLLRQRGLLVQTYFCFGNWYLEVAGRTYTEYLTGLPSPISKKVPYKTRKLERRTRARIEILTEGDGLDQAIRDYECVYQASWKVPEPYPEFIRGLVHTAARNGWLRFGLVHVDDEPAAAQIWIVHAGKALIYKLAYDERFAPLSVGSILTAKLMERVIDIDRVDCVDYLTGDDPYKRDWMSHRRERWGIVAFNPRSLRGCVQAIRHVGGRRMKALLRRTT
jgi:CelD/BcsL family acetyltransferase involved in cellulose biosynthesis